MTQTSPLRVAPEPFENSIASVMRAVQQSLTALLESLPDPIRRAVDVERSMRLEKKLAWQIFRLSRSSDASEIANVPALASVTRVLEAARRKGVPGDVLQRVRDAFEAFERLVTVHGGDRNGLISMASGLTGNKNDQFDLKVRKGRFRADAHIWGIQARLQVRTMIESVIPGERIGSRSTLIAGDIGLQQLHRGRPLTVTSGLKLESEESSLVFAPDRKPREAAAKPGPHDLNLLTEFCTQPLPEMIPQQTIDGRVEMEMVLPTAGRAGATTLYMLHDAVREGVPPDQNLTTRMFMCVPTEAVVCDILTPVGWTDPTTARAMVFGRRHHPERVIEERRIDLLPQRETLDYLGALEDVPPIDGAPRHAESVRHILGRLGLLGTRFDLYRCRIEYPVLHTLLAMRAEGVSR